MPVPYVMANYSDHRLQRIAIAGGGRWARVHATVLLAVTPPDVRIVIHTPHNAPGMRKWALEHDPVRLTIADGALDFDPGDLPDAVIVANAAADHASCAARSIVAGISTLVEKPLALSERAADELVSLAAQRGVVLAASRVLLFARYIEEFTRLAISHGPITELEFAWADPAGEYRYGERKHYDPSLVLLPDMLPHILPILRVLLGPSMRFGSLSIARGGMSARLIVNVGDVPCRISVARNADTRRRSIEVQTARGPARIDFSQEPGRIWTNGSECDADPQWNDGPRPLFRMLSTFLQCATSGVADERLTATYAVEECRIVDRAVRDYRVQQSSWLSQKVGAPLDDEVRYALVEISAADSQQTPMCADELERAWSRMTELGAAKTARLLVDPSLWNDVLRRRPTDND